jgi:hypothetical protein
VTSSAKRKFGALVLTAGIGLSIATVPAEAVTKKKKPKKPTTTKVRAVVAPTTVAPVLPPPPTTAAPVAPSSAPPTAPPTTLSVEEANKQAFARMWAPRDTWRFAADAQLTAEAEAFRLRVNVDARETLFTGSEGRLMETINDGKVVAIVVGLVADPKLLGPEDLRLSALSIASRLKELKVLKIPNGTALCGVNSDGLGTAVIAFDRYLIQVIASSRQTAQDAAFVVSTNMDRLLTE